MEEKEKSAGKKNQNKTKQMNMTHRAIPGYKQGGLREDAVVACNCYKFVADEDVVRQVGQVIRYFHRREGPTFGPFRRRVRTSRGTLE